MFRVLPVLILLASVAIFPTASAAQAQAQIAEPEGEIAVGAGEVADFEIAQRIRNVLAEIDRFADVTVSVSAGVVTLGGQVLDQAAEDELLRVVNRVEGVVAIESEVELSADIAERLAPAIDRVSDRLNDAVVAAPVLGIALLVFAGVSLLGWLLTTRLFFWDRIAPNQFIADIYRVFARIVFVMIGVVLALDVLNATALLGAVLGAAGVAGLAVGFAVRDTVENFIASVLLSLRQPFRPNDFVEIDGVMGNVARLTSRATILISPEGNHVRIPNATVFKGRIVNYSRNPRRRFDFDLGVDAESDLGGALSTAVAAIEALDFVLPDPPVSAFVKDVGDSNVLLTFTGWIDQRQTDFLKARGEAVRIAKTALETAGFGLPEPIYRLRIDGGQMPGPVLSDRASPAPSPPVPASGTDLPDAAIPDRRDTGAEDAVDAERAATDTDGDLLNPRQTTE